MDGQSNNHSVFIVKYPLSLIQRFAGVVVQRNRQMGVASDAQMAVVCGGHDVVSCRLTGALWLALVLYSYMCQLLWQHCLMVFRYKMYTKLALEQGCKSSQCIRSKKTIRTLHTKKQFILEL